MEETVVASPIAKTTDVIAEASLGDTLIGSGSTNSGDGWVILITATVALSVAVLIFFLMGVSKKPAKKAQVTTVKTAKIKSRKSYAPLSPSTLNRPRLIQ